MFPSDQEICESLILNTTSLVNKASCSTWSLDKRPYWASCLITGAVTESPSCSCSTSERSAPARLRVVDTQGTALAADQATGRLQIVPPSAQSGGWPCAILPD